MKKGQKKLKNLLRSKKRIPIPRPGIAFENRNSGSGMGGKKSKYNRTEKHKEEI